MRFLGRSMQMLGLIILPLAVLMQLAEQLIRFYVSQMVIMLVFGAALFYLGRLIEGYAGPAK